jgi:putative protein kinase ArgK-like GTPase of G3E family
MTDFDAFSAALDADGSYSASLSRSLSLVLEEFYENLQAVGVSAVTGEGIQDFFNAVANCRKEYDEEYLPELKRRKAAMEALEEKRKQEDLARLRSDAAQTVAGRGKMVLDGNKEEEEEEGAGAGN